MRLQISISLNGVIWLLEDVRAERGAHRKAARRSDIRERKRDGFIVARHRELQEDLVRRCSDREKALALALEISRAAHAYRVEDIDRPLRLGEECKADP